MEKIEKFAEYQKLAMRTSKDFGSKEKQLEYATIALCGEVGELANLMKKKVYHNKQDISTNNLLDEASDILWYLACLADALNVDLSDIATYNIEKLEKRYNKNQYDEQFYTK